MAIEDRISPRLPHPITIHEVVSLVCWEGITIEEDGSHALRGWSAAEAPGKVNEQSRSSTLSRLEVDWNFR